jgi:hypothetical protein
MGIIRLLLRLGAKLEDKDNAALGGGTILHLAVAHQSPLPILREILKEVSCRENMESKRSIAMTSGSAHSYEDRHAQDYLGEVHVDERAEISDGSPQQLLQKSSLKTALESRNKQGHTVEELAASVGYFDGAALLQATARDHLTHEGPTRCVECISEWVLCPGGCFMLPFVLFSSSLFIFETFPTWLACLTWVGALAAGGKLLQFKLLDLAFIKSRKPALIALGSTVWSTFLGYFHFVVRLAASQTVYSTGFFSFLVALLALCLVQSKTSDPGVIGNRKYPLHTILRNIKQDLDHGNVGILLNLCPTCLSPKPPRSKHCSATDRCVAKFDHYCPFVGNSIGALNHGWFIGFLFFAGASTAYYISMVIPALKESNQSETWMKATLVLAVIHVIWVSGMLVIQCGFIMTGNTTNEYAVKVKQKVQQPSNAPQWTGHTYDHGPGQNCIDFWGIQALGKSPHHFPSDWLKQHGPEYYLSEEKT